MPLTGDRALSPEAWVREQTEQILAAGTTAVVGDAAGPSVVLMTVRGARSGTLQDGATVADHDAHEAAGEERARWWARAVTAFPLYAEYQERTTREIPVFVLEPREG